MCSETDFTQENIKRVGLGGKVGLTACCCSVTKWSNSSIARSLRTWKMHVETPHDEIKCVLSIKESITVRAEGADPHPPLAVSLTVKNPFFDDIPYNSSRMKAIHSTYLLGTTWTKYLWHVSTSLTWVSIGCCLCVAWIPVECHLVVTGVSLGCTCVSLVCHMGVTWGQNMAIFNPDKASFLKGILQD